MCFGLNTELSINSDSLMADQYIYLDVHRAMGESRFFRCVRTEGELRSDLSTETFTGGGAEPNLKPHVFFFFNISRPIFKTRV